MNLPTTAASAPFACASFATSRAVPGELVHGYHTGRNDFVMACCGFKWRRGDPPAKFATEGCRQFVNCPTCIETLRAVGIVAGEIV